jgi:hypothetical protein
VDASPGDADSFFIYFVFHNSKTESEIANFWGEQLGSWFMNFMIYLIVP